MNFSPANVRASHTRKSTDPFETPPFAFEPLSQNNQRLLHSPPGKELISQRTASPQLLREHGESRPVAQKRQRHLPRSRPTTSPPADDRFREQRFGREKKSAPTEITVGRQTAQETTSIARFSASRYVGSSPGSDKLSGRGRDKLSRHRQLQRLGRADLTTRKTLAAAQN